MGKANYAADGEIDFECASSNKLFSADMKSESPCSKHFFMMNLHKYKPIRVQ